MLTQYLKCKEQEILTPFLGELNEYMGQIREKVIAQYDTEAREGVYLKKCCVQLLIMEGFRKYSLKYGIADFKLLFIYKL